MLHILQNPWFALGVIAVVALFFILRDAVQLKKIDRLQSDLVAAQETTREKLQALERAHHAGT